MHLPDQLDRDELLRAMSPGEKFLAAIECTALARQQAWERARLSAGDAGPDAIVDAFVREQYGDEIAERVRRYRQRKRDAAPL